MDIFTQVFFNYSLFMIINYWKSFMVKFLGGVPSTQYLGFSCSFLVSILLVFLRKKNILSSWVCVVEV